MSEVTLFDGSGIDLVLSIDGIIGFLQMSFSLYSANGTTHIGVGWFIVLGYLLLLNMVKAKGRGKRL